MTAWLAPMPSMKRGPNSATSAPTLDGSFGHTDKIPVAIVACWVESTRRLKTL